MFTKDTDGRKMNLGVGAYRDDDGKVIQRWYMCIPIVVVSVCLSVCTCTHIHVYIYVWTLVHTRACEVIL